MKDLPFSKTQQLSRPRQHQKADKGRKPLSLKEKCDHLWAECVKLRAGYRSEYSDLPGEQIDKENGKVLCAHHIAGKPCYRLRYELDNGICLTTGEHAFIAHRADRYEMFRKFVKRLRGEDFYERMDMLKQEGSDLRLSYLYLKQEKAKLLKAA